MNDTYFFEKAQDYNLAKDLVFTNNPVIYYKVFWCGLRHNQGYCIEGLSSLSSSELDWLFTQFDKCNTLSSSSHNNRCSKSSDRRSTYVFQNEQDFNNAKEAIYMWNRGAYDDYNKIYFYGHWGNEYRIDLYDGLSAAEAEKAASIMREHRGRFCPNP